MISNARLNDVACLTARRQVAMLDRSGLSGLLTLSVLGPDGRVLDEETTENLITQVGDQVYGERGGGVTGAPNAATGMRLGTGSTTASKTGAGAAIVTYITGSAKALDAEPVSSLSGANRRLTYVVTWSGSETFTGIQEVVLTNATISDVAGSAADTISRVVITSKTKDSADTLVATWTHDLLGA